MKVKLAWVFWASALAVALLIPRVLGVVGTNLIVELAIAAVFATSLNLLLSYTGLLSFGHALFFGIGAYTTALALRHIDGFGLLPVVMGSALAAMLAAILSSPLLVRVSGTAFAMLTLAFGQLMYVVCLKYREVTGGEDGIAGFPTPSLFSIDMTVPSNFYYFALTVSAVSIAFMWHLTRTPVGSLMIGIGDNADRIAHLGFNVAQTKAVVFVASGTYAGVAGSLFALFHNVVSTDGVLHILVSFAPVMAILVGGIGSFAGPIVGCAILLVIEEVGARWTDRIELLTGLVFLLFVLFAPRGLVGLLSLWRQARESKAPSDLAAADAS